MSSLPFYRHVADKMCANILEEAAQRKANAAYAGAYHDGGSRELEEKVCAFRAGMASQIPSFWVKEYSEAYDDAIRVKDPEYATYKRLKAKFEKE